MSQKTFSFAAMVKACTTKLCNDNVEEELVKRI